MSNSEKINIAELLKNCPKGMELDSPIWDGVVFDHINMETTYPIYIKKLGGLKESLTENGCLDSDPGAKCVVFPKGKTTWEGFQRPFKDGDILTSKAGSIFILKNINIGKNETFYNSYVALDCVKEFYENCVFSCDKNGCRLATKEERGKLFEAIKSNGYKWDFKTKTLEKLIIPKFKVGDKILKKDDTTVTTIKDIRANDYIITFSDSFGNAYITDTLPFRNQNEWELEENIKLHEEIEQLKWTIHILKRRIESLKYEK